MTQITAWLVLVALIGVVVVVFVRAQRRERSGERTPFWPQSSIGQLAAVALGLVVIAAIATAVN